MKRTCETCGEDCTKYMWNANYTDGNGEETGNILVADKFYGTLIKALNDGTILLFGELRELGATLSHAVPVCKNCLENTPDMPVVKI